MVRWALGPIPLSWPPSPSHYSLLMPLTAPPFPVPRPLPFFANIDVPKMISKQQVRAELGAPLNIFKRIDGKGHSIMI